MSTTRSLLAELANRRNLAVLAGALLLAGCASQEARAPGIPAPTPEFMGAGTLEIPRGCEPTHGTIYRTSFMVQADGRVTAATSDSGSGCVQDALREWVATFTYRPPGTPVAATIDWMDVVASRGG